MTPVPEDVCRVQMNFSYPGEELAVMTFHLHLEHGVGLSSEWPEMCQTAAEKVYAKWDEHMAGNAKPYFPTVVKLRDVTTYHLRATDGHAIDRGQYVPTTPWAGTQPTSLPPQVSLAVTLQAYPQGAFVANRARFRGRMYLPPMALTAVADTAAGRAGRTHPSLQNDLGTSLRDFFSDVHRMNVSDDEGPLGGEDYWSLGVLSRKDVAIRRVEAIRLGDVFDTQRRRREQLDEVYVGFDIPNS